MDITPRLSLPFIAPGQAQKELLHNEALQMLDIMVAAAVEEPPLSAPPAAPGLGSCYIVAAGASGAWAGQANKLAGYTSGGWRFIIPRDGVNAFVRSSGLIATFRAGAWELGAVHASQLKVNGDQVVGARRPAIAEPAGGTVIDLEARSAVASILASLRQHGLIQT